MGLPRVPTADNPLHAAALRIWSEARSICGTPAEHYLASRGIRTHSPELRYHPRTPHGPQPVTRYRPALVAAVRDGTGLVAIHRTFIEPPDGSPATAARSKRGLGKYGHGAVRLGGVGPRLGLAEGIETALSATALFGLPCWATLGTERFGRIELPAKVTELLLFLDADAGGRRAEQLARAAFADVASIRAHYPRCKGQDWNDVLCSGVP